MRSHPDHEYKGYTIAFHIWPASGNRYQAEFSAHLPAGNALHLPQGTAIPYSLEHREGRQSGAICETAEEARQDAIDRAYAWIDAHPAKS